MFCLDYFPNKSYVKEVEQLRIYYRPADRTLQDFLQQYQNKSIIIDVQGAFEDLDAELLKGLEQKYQNFRLIINFENKEHLNRVQKYEIPFFFSNYVGTIDEMYGLMKYNPTDMYICEELGFSLDKVSIILHEHNIKVRVIPNLCQSSFAETPSILKFFVRPEDISFYSTNGLIDIFEIVSDIDHQAILYKIYKQGYWAGPIKQVIPNFKEDLDSRFLMDYFAVIRSKCGKRCLYKPDSCDICHRFIELADTFKDNDLFIKKKKTDG